MREESLDMNEGNQSVGFSQFIKPPVIPNEYAGTEVPRYSLWPSHPSEWLHVPPTCMPWSTSSSNQSAVMRFTAGPQHNPMIPKRKFDDDIDSELPLRKMHITEDKMAAHMSDLHISNSYTSHCVGKPTQNVLPDNNVNSVTDVQNLLNVPQRRLFLSAELQKMKNEPILPVELLRKLQEPSTALVLWQPPAGVLGDAIKSVIRTPPTPSTTTAPSLPSRRNNDDEEIVEVEMDNNNSTDIDLNVVPTNQLVVEENSSATMLMEEMDL